MSEHIEQVEHQAFKFTRRKIARLATFIVVLAIYGCAIVYTDAHFMADSGGYVVSVLAYAGVNEYLLENPVVRDYRSENPFWEFGHLLWRPLGLVLLNVFRPLSELVVGNNIALNMFFILISVNVVAGLLSCALLYRLMDTLTGSPWLSLLVTVGFILSHGFLNFTQTASSYITGLALLITGLYLLLKGKGDLHLLGSICAGFLFAASLTMWALYVLAIPAAIAAPLILFGSTRSRLRRVLVTSASFTFFIMLSYLVVMASIGVHSLADLKDWILASSHGVRTSGLTRMVFGFARSFIHMGNDGLLFKRFLLKDPFNPVSMIDLSLAALWKLVVFYGALGSTMLCAVLVSLARRYFTLFLVNALPLLGFAILYDGGAVERYLPLYPILFLFVAATLAYVPFNYAYRILPLAFLVSVVIANSSAMARPTLDRRQQATVARLEPLVPHLKAESSIVITHLQDDLVSFQSSFPFHPLNRHKYQLYALVNVNSAHAPKWRELFGLHVLDRWGKGGEVWLSTRLFEARPQADWNWVEGDDPHVSWNDIHKFFEKLETSAPSTSLDGFVLLDRSESNTQLLQHELSH